MLKKGQSIIEYSVLVGVIAAAFIAMNQYVNRAVGAKLKQVQAEIYDSPEPGVSIPK